MASNPHVNKVVFGNMTLIDTSNVTVTPDKLAEGYTALDASGQLITGTAKTGGGGIKWAKYETMNGETFAFADGDELSEDELRHDCVFCGYCHDSSYSYAFLIAGSQIEVEFQDILIFSELGLQNLLQFAILDYSNGVITIEQPGFGFDLEGYLYAFVVG